MSDLIFSQLLIVPHYTPNFKKVEGAYCFGLVHVCVSLGLLEKKNRVFKFHKQIPHQKNSWPEFFLV